MALSPIAFIAPNYRDFSIWWFKVYIPGTTTPKSIALDSLGATTAAKLELNADGFLISSGGTLVIPYIDGAYDLWLFPTEVEADANNTSNAIRVADDIQPILGTDDLSQSYTFPTVAALKGSLIVFPVGKVLKTKGGTLIDDGKGRTYQVAAAQGVDDVGDLTLSDGKVALLKSSISVETSTGTSESSLAIIIGDSNYDPKVIGEGSVLIGGYQQVNKNRLTGTTELRAIIAGYDCEITERGASDDGGLACVIVGSHHSEIQGDATHTIIQGGSYLTATDGDYNGLIGGTLNELRNNNARPTHSGVIFGRESVADNANAFIAGSLRSTASGEFSSIISGQDSLAEGNFDSVTGSKNESRKGTLGNGQKNTIGGGRFIIIDSITSPQGNTVGGGEDIAVYGVYNYNGGGSGGRIGTPTVNSTYAVLSGGLDNKVVAETAGGVFSGRLNESDGDYSCVTHGRESKSSAEYSRAGGYQSNATLDASDVIADGMFDTIGDAQTAVVPQKAVTTDGNPTVMGTLVMPDNTSWMFQVNIIARRPNFDESGAYTITGCIKRNAGAASAALVGVPIVTVIAEDSPAWDVEAAASTGSGGLAINVTGEVGETIRWASRVMLSQVSG